jgi:hypothetical protein
MKHDYSKLDAAILARIAAGRVNFTQLQGGEVGQLARALNESAGDHVRGLRFKPAWRFVDARLQALRKAGRITYQRKPEGWVLAAPSTQEGQS